MNKQDRIKTFNRILTSLIAEVDEQKQLSIDFEGIAASWEIHKHYVYKVVMLLIRDFKALKKLPKNRFVAQPELWQVSGGDIDMAYQAYQKAFNDQKKPLPDHPLIPEIVDACAPAISEPSFGYIIATSAVYFDTLEEAQLEAQIQAMRHGLTHITLVQKLKEIEVPRPIVRTINATP